jgi:hypothetical protein
MTPVAGAFSVRGKLRLLLGEGSLTVIDAVVA